VTYCLQSARSIASSLLKHPAVAGEIGRLMAEKVKKIEMNEEEILRELEAVARANAADFAELEEREALDRAGNPRTVLDMSLKPTSELSPDKRRALAGIKQGTHGVELKLYDKMRALELLMRYRGMLRDKAAEGSTIEYPEEMEGEEY
jgi:phage terminase small subunit